MYRHALRTALTLYRGGTLDVETAARKAGVEPARLRRAVDHVGGRTPTPTADVDRLPVGAD